MHPDQPQGPNTPDRLTSWLVLGSLALFDLLAFGLTYYIGNALYHA
ncbi:hypothetical protein [Pseudomonas sp. C9-3]|nr:hypothetical protein [Pseudomonas sp. C9-3]